MIKVYKNKYAQICLSLLTAASLIFITSLTYFLGWEFEWCTFWIYFGAIAAEVTILAILCIALIASNKYFYLISPESVKMFKKEEELFTLPNTNIMKIKYVGFAWVFMMQMDAGELRIEYTDTTGKIKPTISYSDKKIYSISMSHKQAKQVARILNKDLQNR